MDDKSFDKIVKEKAEVFQDSGHDAQALTDLRKRLSNLPGAKKNSWSGGRIAYMVGSMVLFTLVNFAIVWYFSEGRHASLTDEIDQLKSERSQFISLQEELVELRELKVDTIYVYRNLVTTRNTGSAGLQFNQANSEVQENYSSLPSGQADGYFQLVPDDQKLSEELEDFLRRNNLLIKKDGGKMTLVVQNQPVFPMGDFRLSNNYNPIAPGMPDNLPKVGTFEELDTQKKPEKKKIPNKMLWALEKHNHSGVDFQFGVEGKFHKGNYDVGVGDNNGGMGLITEVIFSPVLRLETGIHFGARSYKIGDTEIDQLPAEFFDDYPGYNDQLGTLSSLESDADLIKIPLNLKVFSILDHNKKWYASAGLTPQWAMKQELEYKYALSTPSPPIDGAEYVSFVGSKQEISSAYYTTTFNLGVGTEVYLNEKLRWQLGVFYQKGLSKVGVENRKLKSSFGVKSSLWFNRP